MEDLRIITSEALCQRFKESRISSNLEFLITDTCKLSQISGKTCEEIEEIKLKLSKIIHKPNKIVRAIDLLALPRLSTGCKTIDSVLRNGIPINHVVEIFGCSGVGKTQFCLQLTLQVQLPIDSGGLDKGAVYIFTEDVFPSKRLHELANLFKIKHDHGDKDVESSIFLKHCPDIQSLQKCLSLEVPLLFRCESIGLVIVDSISGPFRAENEKEYMIRNRDLIPIAHKLNDICMEYNTVVVCTNQVSDNVLNNKTEPCLGVVWSNSINYRLQISRFNNSSLREFEVVFSPEFANKKCTFSIAHEGLKSVN